MADDRIKYYSKTVSFAIQNGDIAANQSMNLDEIEFSISKTHSNLINLLFL